MLKLIVGLGNPGDEYAKTRHNAGFWFLDQLNNRFAGTWQLEKKFFSEYAQINIANCPIRLIKPQTFMNASGKAVAAIANFYNIAAEDILIVHDELDFCVGTIKAKVGGGHGGHNGLRDIISALGSANFYRLRIGIGKPQDRNQTINYVLKSPSKDEMNKINDAIVSGLKFTEIFLAETSQVAINFLNSQN